MSLAENLLNSLDETAYANTRIAGGGIEEEHIVVDASRTITVPANLKTIAVKGDKDIETVTIDCIRYWDGHDLSTFAIYINYILPNGDEGTYIPENITKLDDIFTFDWKIGSEFTYSQGKLTFWIVAKLTDNSGTLVRQWSSFQNSDCTIAQGGDKIYVPEKQTDQDVISQAISISRASAEAAEKAATNAREAAEDEVSRIIGELGVVQELGDSPNSVVSQLKVTKEFNKTNAKINRNSKRITNLEQGLPYEQFMTDSTVAHVKDVPVNALPFAEVSKVGGMTRKCRNLIPYPYPHTTKTLHGITFTDNGDGTVTANGTATEQSYFVLRNPTVLPIGKYFLSGAPNDGGGTQIYTSNGDYSFYKVDLGSGIAVDITTEDEFSIVINILKDTVVNNVVFKPMLNEGSTALPYEPYYEGLRDAKVTEMKSVGVNLAPAQEVYKGTNLYAEMVVDGRNCIRITSGESTKKTPIQFEPNTQYTVSFYAKSENYGGATQYNICFAFFYEDGTADYIINPVGETSWMKKTLTSAAGKTVIAVGISAMEWRLYTYIDIDTFMLNKGTEALPYTPYMESTLPIPEAVQSLDGYGEGNPDNAEEYNAIINKDGKWKYSHKGNIKNISWVPLATPEVTDISDLLSADNFLAVEGNGSITAVNEYGYDVPSEIEYQLEV